MAGNVLREMLRLFCTVEVIRLQLGVRGAEVVAREIAGWLVSGYFLERGLAGDSLPAGGS